MLAAFPHMSSAPHAFLPPTPSPLSPRSANIYGPRATFMSEEKQKKADAAPFSKRPIKKAPSPKQDELKERRRNIFLRKVNDGREEKRFEARGEDIMRLDFVQKQRAWEAELAREAPAETSEPEEEMEEEGGRLELPTSSSSNAMQISSTQQQQQPEDEVDEVLQREDRELEALLEYLPENDWKSVWHAEEEPLDERLYSDDGDDYDALFEEFVEQDAMVVSSGQQQLQHVQEEENEAPVLSQGGDEMDMS